MTPREKILSAVVAAIVLVLAVGWIGSRVQGAIEDREKQQRQIEEELASQESKVRRGTIAKSQLNAWTERSLPSDTSRATTQYRVWLHSLTQKSGLQAEVKPAGERRHGDLFVQHIFQVTGQADLRRLIQFLHDFYSVGYLHRISAMSARPVPDKKELDVSLTIEALSLTAAPKEKEGEPPPGPNLARDVDSYTAAIVGRNVFAPENNPPRIASMGTQQGNPNRSLSFTVRATDPDKLDRLTYAFESAAPEGAKIDPKTGEFRWTPSKTGEQHEIAIRVTDDGMPPKSSVEKIKIAVLDPPPVTKEAPILKDDPARDAKITAMVGSADDLQVWVTVPRGLGDQPKTLHLNPGDPISVGSFVGVVKNVREREAEFELKDGRTVVVRLDQPLVSSPNSSGG